MTASGLHSRGRRPPERLRLSTHDLRTKRYHTRTKLFSFLAILCCCRKAERVKKGVDQSLNLDFPENRKRFPIFLVISVACRFPNVYLSDT
jgi:hypothetical protein